MIMNENKDSFHYSYSAAQQKEIEKIREKYLPPKEDKMEQLRRLDQRVTQKGIIAGITAGIIGSLILGIGMCCCMVWQGIWFIPGIFIGLIGIAGICLAYPLHNRVIKKQREKIAPEMIRLTNELTK